jgi:hypothetical protein
VTAFGRSSRMGTGGRGAPTILDSPDWAYTATRYVSSLSASSPVPRVRLGCMPLGPLGPLGGARRTDGDLLCSFLPRITARYRYATMSNSARCGALLVGYTAHPPTYSGTAHRRQPRTGLTVGVDGADPDIFDVRTFGAVGDSIADDTHAFEAALTAGASGGVLYTPPGTYRISSVLAVPSALSVQGSGWDSILLWTEDADLLVWGAHATPRIALLLVMPPRLDTRHGVCSIPCSIVRGSCRAHLHPCIPCSRFE